MPQIGPTLPSLRSPTKTAAGMLYRHAASREEKRMAMDTVFWSEYHYTTMTFGVISTGRGVTRLFLPDQSASARELYQRSHPDTAIIPSCQQMAPVLSALARYFEGENPPWPFDLDLRGTAFQRAVWNHIRQIPYGSVTTYGQIARDMGNPHAARAVGKAAGDNPIPIIIPCHRVVGSNGTLTGFAGGLRLKAWLLQHEGVGHINPKGHDRFAF